MPPTGDPPRREQSPEPASDVSRHWVGRVTDRTLLSTTDIPPGYDIPSRDELADADVDGLSTYVDELSDALDACKTRLEEYEESHEFPMSELSERREVKDTTHQQFRTVAAETRRSVLAVSEPWSRLTSKRVVGTAWVLDDGLVVTAAPIVEGPTEEDYPEWEGEVPDWPDRRQLWTIDGSERAVDTEHVLDDAVAVLEAETDGIEPLSLASEGAIDDGDPLLAIGHPMFVGEWVPTLGTHAGAEDDGRFRLDAPVSKVSTSGVFLPSRMLGSPVFNANRKVVGVVVDVQERESAPTIGTYSRSERVFQQLPDTFDLVVLRADRLRNAVETVSTSDVSIARDRPDSTEHDGGAVDD